MENPYTYIFVRTDISYEQQVVQAAHAALEAGFEFDKPSVTSSIVLIPAKDMGELHMIAARLEENQIQFKMFHEPDFGMGDSAIATQPITSAEQRRVMRKYKLYKVA